LYAYKVLRGRETQAGTANESAENRAAIGNESQVGSQSQGNPQQVSERKNQRRTSADDGEEVAVV
jgi:hypothetical protein